MKTGNVSFGARLGAGTLDFLVEARKLGLKTEKMETLMKSVYPRKGIFTFVKKNPAGEVEGITSMQIANNKNVNYPDFWIKGYNRNFIPGITGIKKVIYPINQSLINELTESLKKIQDEENLRKAAKAYAKKEERAIKAQLIRKFGEPI